MPVEPAATRLLHAVAPVLERFGDRWYLFGAQAVIIWGRPRLTADVDITVFLRPDDPETFVAAMDQAGFDLRVRDVRHFARTARVLPFVHLETELPLDVVLGGPGLEEEFLQSVERVDLGGTAISVIGPAELVVTKILAGRPKDLEDVRGILRARGSKLDVERVRQLLGLVEAAIDQRDLLPLFEEQLQGVRAPRR